MNASATFTTSLRIQRRIIGALLLRELLTRFGRHNIGFLWLFVEPMLFTAGVLGIWTLYHRSPTPFPLTAFCISGYGTVGNDDKAKRAKNPGLKSAYERLRPQAKKHVEEAVPRVGRTLTPHL